MRHSQVGLELLFVMGILFVAFAIIGSEVNYKKNEINKQNDLNKIENECNKLSELVINTYINGGQVSASIDYYIQFINSTIIVINEEKEISTLCTIPNVLANYSYAANRSIHLAKTTDGVVISE